VYVLEDSLQLSLRFFVCAMCLDVNRASVAEIGENIRAKCTVSLRMNAQISAYIFKLI